MAGQNGNSASMYNGMTGPPVEPSPGHYMDIQMIIENMENLSGWLQQNREEWAEIQDGLARVERLQGRLARDGQSSLQNGDSQSLDTDDHQSTNAGLQNDLATAKNTIASLEKAHADQNNVLRTYDETLHKATDQIRHYCSDQAQHITSLHQHYTRLLEQSRRETMEAQFKHQDWQASFQRVSEGVRMALAESEAKARPWKAKAASLKEENRILRRRVGWEPPEDSSSEEDEDVEVEVEVERRDARRRRRFAEKQHRDRAAAAAQAVERPS